MSSTVTEKKLFTAEEFFLLPDPADGSRQELLRGEIITMPPPGMLHGACCANTVGMIMAFIKGGAGGNLVCNDTGVITGRGPDSVRGPDAAYWAKGRLKELSVGYAEIAPDFVVEVLSPSNTTKQICEKRHEYFAKGVRLVWVLSPEDRTLAVYKTLDEGRLLHESAMVTGEDVLQGFTCRVSDLLP